MENVKAIDSIGVEFGIGTAVAVLTAGNFIYGHVTAINEDKIEVIPDIGYRTSKPNFRLKKIYKTTSNHIAVLKDQEKFIKKKKMTKRLYAFSENEFISLFTGTNKYFEEVMNNDAAVISISEPDKPHHILDDSRNVLNVEFGDDDSMSLETALRICKFIQDNIGKNFYIHCSAGKSRSQGVVRYMIDVYPEVDWKTRTDNPCITPNYHVVGQLKRSWMLLYNRNSDYDI